MTDISYTQCGLFTRFYPESPEGESVWRELAKNDGVAAVLNTHAASVIAQIKRAGYTVKKYKPNNNVSIDDIFNDLKEMGL